MSSQKAPMFCLVALLSVVIASQRNVFAQTEGSDLTARFFYFNGAEYDWVDSTDEQALQLHIGSNEVSFQLFSSLRQVLESPEQADAARTQFADWIARQRASFQAGRSSAETFRRTEGLVAYLRAHELQVKTVVSALKRRSGASAVHLIAIHQDGNEQSQPLFMLKVVLKDPKVDLGQSGYIVRLQSPNISYVTVLYAMGIALYELNELQDQAVPTEQPSEQDPAPIPSAA